MSKTLYEWDKGRNPDKYRVGNKLMRVRGDNHPCANCVVFDCRSPEHCDTCPVNPDRERLKKIGLL